MTHITWNDAGERLVNGVAVDRVGADVQRLYDATTRFISVCPTGRVDLGASQAYHDAMLALTTLRDELRRSGAVTHDESFWEHP